jgi:pimeloyl-ACP methyl ester carboxylesterase
LVALYSRPGAFTASIAWYRSRAGSVASARGEQPPEPGSRVTLPVEVLWPEDDPLFPVAWSDRLGDWYADPALTVLPGCGHFVPLEAPEAFADAVRRALHQAGARAAGQAEDPRPT